MALTITAVSTESGTAALITVTTTGLGTLRIERTVANGQQADVLLYGTLMTGTLEYVDRTVPFGVAVTYRAVQTIPLAAALSDTDTLAALPFPTDDGVCYPCVVSDPTAPELIQPATLQVYRPFDQPARQGVYDIIGQRYPIALNGYRSAPRGKIALITHTQEQALLMRTLLYSGRTLIFRVPSEARPEQPSAALSFGNIAEEPVILTDISRPERKWTMDFVEVAVPTITELGLGSGNTWAEIVACNPTWTSLVGATANWTTAVYDPSVADC